jgi:hypothetical protein
VELVVECAMQDLPAMSAVVGPRGLAGAALEATEETMSGLDAPMTPGSHYWVTSPAGDLFHVEARDGDLRILLDALASLPAIALEYAVALAGRLQELVGGRIRDETTGRELVPTAPEHVVVESVENSDGLWIRTRGLAKFGRPELEVYGVARDDRTAAVAAMERVAVHLAAGGTIEPGRTLGVGAARLVAREGERNRGSWGDTVVLELVDVDVSGDSLETGRVLGRRDWLGS